MLLRHGVNLVSAENGMTPLISALKAKRGLQWIQMHLEKGADVNMGDKPAIFAAIESEDIEVIAAVLDAGADFNTVYQETGDLSPTIIETPLSSAALTSMTTSATAREAIVTLLLQRGADPLMEIEDGKTTVFNQIVYQASLIAPILKAGVNLEIIKSYGRTPLLTACFASLGYRDSEDQVLALIQAGANVHATGRKGCTPLHLAVQSNRLKSIISLLEHGASPSVTDNQSLPPLYYVFSHNLRDESPFYNLPGLTRTLFISGASPHITGPNGETAMHLLAPVLMNYGGWQESEHCSRNDCKALYTHLISFGCSPHARDNDGNTPLWNYVLEVNEQDEFSIYFSEDARVHAMFDLHDVHAVNFNGDTLLHAVAAREESFEPISEEEVWSSIGGICLFRELVKRGVDRSAENKQGLTALDVAAASGNEGLLELFKSEEWKSVGENWAGSEK